MKLIIHRGAKQVDRSGVELATEPTRLFIGAALSLDDLQDPVTARSVAGVDPQFRRHSHPCVC